MAAGAPDRRRRRDGCPPERGRATRSGWWAPRAPTGSLAARSPIAFSGGAGDDRINGREGRDRLSGGRGDDRINAVDGRKDRSVRGGPGRTPARSTPPIGAASKGCENVKVKTGGGGGSCVAAPGAEADRGSRPSSPAALPTDVGRRPAADLQRSLLRDHDHAQCLRERRGERPAADLDRGGL